MPGKQLLLKNINNVTASISTYGARWVSMCVPDHNKNIVDIIVSPQENNDTNDYYGAIIGRYANRIANGKFILGDKKYELFTNNGCNHLHGGNKGFNAAVWDIVELTDNTISLKYTSIDGEEGFPGNLETIVQYTLTDENELQIKFHAFTDKATIINLTNHAYFNLNGHGSILDHTLFINADKYTPIDNTSIPLGHIETVENTPFDFRQTATIGARIDDNNIQLKYGSGYDHNFILNKDDEILYLAAIAEGDHSKIKMTVFTTEPGLQLYTGNFMEGKNILTNGNRDNYRTAFCLETQHFPDSPNHPSFPSVVLLPGEKFESISIFKFSVD